MNIIPTLIIIWIVWSVVKNISKTNKSQNKTVRMQRQKAAASSDQSWNSDQSWSYDNAGSGAWDNPPAQTPRASYNKQAAQQTLQHRLAAAKKTVAYKPIVKKTKAEKYNQTGLNRPAEVDLNPNRREDWGQRGDRGLTPKTIVIIIGLGFFLLFVLSKITPSDLGL